MTIAGGTAGWGKAVQPHEGSDGGDIHVIIRQIVSHEEPPLLIEHEPPGK